jgi:hypothetical protein
MFRAWPLAQLRRKAKRDAKDSESLGSLLSVALTGSLSTGAP